MWAFAFHIVKVDIHSIYARLVLRVTIQPCFCGPPVELRRPVLAEPLQPLNVRTRLRGGVYCRRSRHLVWQLGEPHPLEDGVDTFLRYCDLELSHQVWPSEVWLGEGPSLRTRG